MTTPNKNQDSFKNSFINYFKGVRLEWGKVTWPEKQQVIVETIYVIVIVFVFTVLVLLMDLIFKGIFDVVRGFVGH